MKKHIWILIAVLLLCGVCSGVGYSSWMKRVKAMEFSNDILYGKATDAEGLGVKTHLAILDKALSWKCDNPIGKETYWQFSSKLPVEKPVDTVWGPYNISYSGYKTAKDFPVYDGVINSGHFMECMDEWVEFALSRDEYANYFSCYWEGTIDDGGRRLMIQDNLSLQPLSISNKGKDYQLIPYIQQGYGFLEVHYENSPDNGQDITWLFLVTDQEGAFMNHPKLLLKRECKEFTSFAFVNGRIAVTYAMDGKQYLEVFDSIEEPVWAEVEDETLCNVWSGEKEILYMGVEQAVYVDVSKPGIAEVVKCMTPDTKYADPLELSFCDYSCVRKDNRIGVLASWLNGIRLSYRVITFDTEGTRLYDSWYDFEVPGKNELWLLQNEIYWNE